MNALSFHQALTKYRADQARDNRGRFADEGRNGSDGDAKGVRHLLLTRYKLKPREAAAGLERQLGLKQFKGKTRAEFDTWLKRVVRSVPKDKLFNAALNLRPDVASSSSVDIIVQRLRNTVRDNPEGFASTYEALQADRDLSARDIIDIAHRFVGGTRKTSRRAAIAAIGQERLRLQHQRAKGDAAARTRTW